MTFALVTVIAIIGAASLAANGDVPLPEKLRNLQYFKFIDTDPVHAACYYTFCECSKEPYSGRISPLHEESCDSHRIGLSHKNVFKCTEDASCMAQLAAFEKGLFSPLFQMIESREIGDEACTFYLSTCYGMLLRDAVALYDKPGKPYVLLP